MKPSNWFPGTVAGRVCRPRVELETHRGPCRPKAADATRTQQVINYTLRDILPVKLTEHKL